MQSAGMLRLMFAVLLTQASAKRVVRATEKENPEDLLLKARDAECEDFVHGSVYAIEKPIYTFTRSTQCKCRMPEERVFCSELEYQIRIHNHYFNVLPRHPCAGDLHCRVEQEPASEVAMRQEANEMERYNCAPGQGQAASTYSETGKNSYEGCARLCDEDVECQGFDLTFKETFHPELFSFNMNMQKPDSCRLYKENTPRLGDAGMDNRRYCTKMTVKVATNQVHEAQVKPRTVKGSETGQDSATPETSDPATPETSEPGHIGKARRASLERARLAREKKELEKLAAAWKELEDDEDGDSLRA